MPKKTRSLASTAEMNHHEILVSATEISVSALGPGVMHRVPCAEFSTSIHVHGQLQEPAKNGVRDVEIYVWCNDDTRIEIPV